MTPSIELRDRILQAVRNEPAETRTTVVLRGTLLLAASVSVALAAFVMKGGVRVSTRPLGLVVLTAGGAVAIAALVAWFALTRGRSMLGRTSETLIALALGAPAALFVWKIFRSSQYADMMSAWPGRVGLRCLALSMCTATAPLLALAYTRRSTDAVRPGLTGLALGAAAGAFAWVFVDLWCPVAYLPHLLIGHVLPIVLLSLAGAVLGQRMLAVR